ncbi:MAG TPA: hypothetical protein ENK84_07160 [Desulfobulbus sp.]|nr:hypothetical protein [Desulfobulbus sp.]
MAAIEQNFPTKDRRMLVLFLFGAFLLVCDVSASLRYVVGDHSQGGMRGAGHDFRNTGREAGQGTGQGDCLSPQLSFFLGKPMAINRASLEDLVLLPGIGRYRAARILARRRQAGPVHTLVELEEIPGISRTLARKINAMISFDSSSCAQSIHAD